jgi:hypothetical protein
VKCWSHCRSAALAVVGGSVAWNGVLVAASPGLMRRTYGLDVGDDPDLVLLLRHRAVLLALSGLLLAVSAGRPALRATAIPAAAVGMASFVGFSVTSEVNTQQRKVALADTVLLLLLAAGALPDRLLSRGEL